MDVVKIEKNPDGSKTITYAYPDGTKDGHHPDGTQTRTYPDGRKVKVP